MASHYDKKVLPADISDPLIIGHITESPTASYSCSSYSKVTLLVVVNFQSSTVTIYFLIFSSCQIMQNAQYPGCPKTCLIYMSKWVGSLNRHATAFHLESGPVSGKSFQCSCLFCRHVNRFFEPGCIHLEYAIEFVLAESSSGWNLKFKLNLRF